jgi:hypothetical protein
MPIRKLLKFLLFNGLRLNVILLRKTENLEKKACTFGRE